MSELAVVVPVWNAAASLPACLRGLRAAHRPGVEVLFVDDGCTDESRALIEDAGFAVIANRGPGGPAAARNLGAAHTTAPLLLFTDADVELAPDTLEQVLAAFEDPGLHALFGSYTRDTPVSGFTSDFKNLTHHYTHQRARTRSASFWTGCGAVRRAVFEAVGGFDTAWARPTIEDVELGLRMARSGYRVEVAPDLQVQHHKRYTWWSLVRSDALDRAMPWAGLLLRDGVHDDLSTTRREAAALGLAWATLATLPTPLSLGFGAAWVGVNAPLFRFMAQHREPAWVVRGVAARWVYHLSGGVGLALGLTRRARWRR